jgi:hypothetical protein
MEINNTSLRKHLFFPHLLSFFFESKERLFLFFDFLAQRNVLRMKQYAYSVHTEGECCSSISTQGDKHKHSKHTQFKCLLLPEQRLYSNTARRNTMAATQMLAHLPACIPSNAMRHNTGAFHLFHSNKM